MAAPAVSATALDLWGRLGPWAQSDSDDNDWAVLRLCEAAAGSGRLDDIVAWTSDAWVTVDTPVSNVLANPDFDADASGWAPVNCQLAQTNAAAQDGAGCCEVTALGAGGLSVTAVLPVDPWSMACAAGDVVTFDLYGSQVAAGALAGAVGVEWIAADGTTISSVVAAPVVLGDPGQWVRLQLSAVAPDLAVGVRASFRRTAGAAGEAVRIDAGRLFVGWPLATIELRPGWSAFVDVERCPEVALPWLAQMVGVRSAPADSDWRTAIRTAPGMRRGTPSVLVATAQKYLKGTKSVTLAERDTSAYHATLHVYAKELIASTYDELQVAYPTLPAFEAAFPHYSDIPSTSSLDQAIQAVKPAAIVLVLSVDTGASYNVLQAGWPMIPAFEAAFPTYDVATSYTP